MGEKSKLIGEIGENVAKNFFELLGWNELRPKIEIPCIQNKKHAIADNEKGRRTHGLDLLFSYHSPLESGVVEHVIVSVKFTGEEYPSSPKKTFKGYMIELAQMIECYNRSEIKSQQIKALGSATKSKYTGVLFWCSSHPNTYDSLVAKVKNSIFDIDSRFEVIHLIDNDKVYFLFQGLTFLKSQYPLDEICFYYPETNMTYMNRLDRSGNILPVEFLSSPIISFLIRKNNNNEIDTFCILCKDNFDKNTLIGLIQVSKEYVGGIKCDYLFLFPDYNSSMYEHKKYVEEAKVGANLSGKVYVQSYLTNIGSLNHE